MEESQEQPFVPPASEPDLFEGFNRIETAAMRLEIVIRFLHPLAWFSYAVLFIGLVFSKFPFFDSFISAGTFVANIAGLVAPLLVLPALIAVCVRPLRLFGAVLFRLTGRLTLWYATCIAAIIAYAGTGLVGLIIGTILGGYGIFLPALWAAPRLGQQDFFTKYGWAINAVIGGLLLLVGNWVFAAYIHKKEVAKIILSATPPTVEAIRPTEETQ